ncbi:MAG: hypothetical protein ACOX3T_05760 [Bdellovibrionota bacterium]
MKYLNKNLYKNFITFFFFVNLLSFSACSIASITSYTNQCKNHANIKINVKRYVNSQYSRRKFLRLGIFPFSVPANFSSYSVDRADYGTLLAQELQPTLLSLDVFSTAELLDYNDWSNKKQEFFSNNIKAIEIGKNLGLDFIVVGAMSPNNFVDKMTVYSKIIDVNTGITIFYGETTGINEKFENKNFLNANFNSKSDPSDLMLDRLTNTTMRCHGNLILNSISK